MTSDEVRTDVHQTAERQEQNGGGPVVIVATVWLDILLYIVSTEK